jgi:hypothetical protein
MRPTQVFHVATAVIVALLGVLLLGIFLDSATASLASPNVAREGLSQAEDVDLIQAAPVISIPFEISDTLYLGEYGREVLVAGHGEGAWPGVFEVEVTIAQSSTKAVAYGEARCHLSGEGVRVSWRTLAEALGPEPFKAQSAHVYAKATVFDPPGRTTVYEWDKEVTLQAGNSYSR